MLAHGIIVNRKSICNCIEMMQMNHKSIYLCLCMFSIEVFFFLWLPSIGSSLWPLTALFQSRFHYWKQIAIQICSSLVCMEYSVESILNHFFLSLTEFEGINCWTLICMLYFVLKGMSKPFNNIKFSPHEWEAHRWNLNMLWLVSLFHLYHSIRELIQWIHFVEPITCRSIDSLKFEIHSIVSNCKINFRIAIFNAGVWILNFEYWAMLLQLITFRTLGNGLICKYCMLVHCYPGI